VLGVAVDVLKLVGGSEGGSEWGSREEEGIVVGISSCSIHAGGSLAKLFLLRQSCR